MITENFSLQRSFDHIAKLAYGRELLHYMKYPKAYLYITRQEKFPGYHKFGVTLEPDRRATRRKEHFLDLEVVAEGDARFICKLEYDLKQKFSDRELFQKARVTEFFKDEDMKNVKTFITKRKNQLLK